MPNRQGFCFGFFRNLEIVKKKGSNRWEVLFEPEGRNSLSLLNSVLSGVRRLRVRRHRRPTVLRLHRWIACDVPLLPPLVRVGADDRCWIRIVVNSAGA